MRENFYKIGVCYEKRGAVLENSYLRADLEIELQIAPEAYGLQDIGTYFETLPKIGIRAAIAAFSITGGQVGHKCNCKTACQKDSCKCFKAGKKCTSSCHKKSTCCLNQDQPKGAICLPARDSVDDDLDEEDEEVVVTVAPKKNTKAVRNHVHDDDYEDFEVNKVPKRKTKAKVALSK